MPREGEGQSSTPCHLCTTFNPSHSTHPASGHLLPRSHGRRDTRTTAVEAIIPDHAEYHPTPITLRSRCIRQSLDTDVAKRNCVIVAGESKETARSRLTGMRTIREEFRHCREVNVQDDIAVQFDLDLTSIDCDFLKVPGICRPQETAFCRCHTIC